MDNVAMAIADPTRRAILDALVRHSRSAGELAALFPVSRPAISRHLRVLRECGLISDQVIGRHRIYSLQPDALNELQRWINSLVPAKAWVGRMDALATEVHRAKRDRLKSETEKEQSA
jgi:DNA-binding transcriptional ArsR family regulator